MALFNEIQVGRINRFVQKYLAIKGQPPVPTVASDLHIIQELNEHSIELEYLHGWDTFAAFASPTGSAGNKSAHEMRNPASSNVFAVVYRWQVFSATGGDSVQLIRIPNATQDQASGSLPGPFAIDHRGRPSSTAIISHDNAGAFTLPGAGTATNLGQFGLVANSNIELLRPGDEFLVGPGDALYIINGVNAQTIYSTIWWRERFIEDAERA